MTRISWFTIHVVREGEHYGRNKCLTHDKARPLIEFYDTREKAVAMFGEEGQFVSRYYLDTLERDADRRPGGLRLDGGVPAWDVDQIDLRCALIAARKELG